MTTAIENTSHQPYTWAGAALAWGDPGSAGKTLDGFGVDSWEGATSEQLGIASLGSRAASKHVFSGFTIAHDGDPRVIGKMSIEPVNLVESLSRQWEAHFTWFESLSISSAPAKTLSRSQSEFFSITHAGDRRAVTKTIPESLSLAENGQHSATFARIAAESLSIGEISQKTLSQAINEFVRLYDGIQLPRGLAVSDMVVSSGDLTDDSFAKLLDQAKIPGFAPWRDFVPGDYEYQLATFRAVLTSKNNDRGMLTNIQAIVDVPDIIDRGSATIEVASQGVDVHFTRTYHIIPEIVLTTKGGTGSPAIPIVESVDLNGFHAVMKDTSGVLVTGVFAWASHGY